jgi:ubiquinone/menaquinone biosynthesis C-methylase UbiE
MDEQVLQKYYAKRAKEYEEIYFRNDPVRQKAQKQMAEVLKKTFKNKSVLEIACGTGYWTQFISETAQCIVATDVNQEMLDIAKQKPHVCPVTYSCVDAFNLFFTDHTFTGGLANFWFSHISKDQIISFLKEFHRVLVPGSPVFMADNVLLPEEKDKVIHKPGDKNTYRSRTLKDGTKYEVLKNYYSQEELVAVFQPLIPKFSIKNCVFNQQFWYVTYASP